MSQFWLGFYPLQNQRTNPMTASPDPLWTALKRQCDNMAFIINHMDVGRWYEKFYKELEEDQAALSLPPQPEGEALLRAAIRMRDILTADVDPPSIYIPAEIDDASEFTQAFDDLAVAIRSLKGAAK
jgi:hypothetical protein